jgi:hypothetical protein
MISLYLQYASLITGAIALSMGWFRSGFVPGGIISLILGGFWTFSNWRQFRWASLVGFVFYVLVSIVGLWLGMPPWSALIGVIGALLAWDLDHFNHRLSISADSPNRFRLERRHLLRLGWVIVPATLVNLIAYNFTFSLTIGWAILLSLLVVGGISILIYRVRSN